MTDPDNIAGGYTTINPSIPMTIVFLILAITITISAACIINYLCDKNENYKKQNWIKPTIILSTLVLVIILVILGTVIISRY